MDLPRDAASDLDPALLNRFDQLKNRPFEELQTLPESHVIEVEGMNGPLKAVIWKDLLEDGQVRLVLQSCSAGSCCVVGVGATGFLMSPDGTCSSVPKAQMAEFSLDD